MKNLNLTVQEKNDLIILLACKSISMQAEASMEADIDRAEYLSRKASSFTEIKEKLKKSLRED